MVTWGWAAPPLINTPLKRGVNERRLRNVDAPMGLEEKGWNFGFDAEKATLVENAKLEFWVDNQNRGRLLNKSAVSL